MLHHVIEGSEITLCYALVNFGSERRRTQARNQLAVARPPGDDDLSAGWGEFCCVDDGVHEDRSVARLINLNFQRAADRRFLPFQNGVCMREHLDDVA